MVRLLLYIKHHCAFIWSIAEWLNSLLFSLRYGKVEKEIENCLKNYSNSEFSFSLLTLDDVKGLSQLLINQPADYLSFFNPHKFDVKSLNSLCRNKAFIMMIAKDEKSNKIVGYFFLRCFFNGKAFRGKLVDINNQRRGLAKKMGMMTMDICASIHLRLFATISKDNIKSLASSRAVNILEIVEELSDDYVLVEYKQKDI